jgi:hypothetical protein
MPAPGRRLASISLDLDDLWSYLRTHGEAGWETRPSFLAWFVPEVLDILEEEEVKLTFFVVGADAALPRNRSVLRAITDRGHEIGNHSFEHEPWLHRFDRSRMTAEIVRTQEAIADATGRRPYGFRGPGYSWSPLLFEVLADQGYRFDASTLPTYLGPLARAYYFRTAGLSSADRARRHALFGNLRDGLLAVKPYRWQLPDGRTLLEIPVSTLPVIKIPFHLTYLHYLSRWSERVALRYLGASLAVCRLSGMSPSFILHPLDLVGGDRVPRLRFFPAMDLPSDTKLGLFRRVLRRYRRDFRLVPLAVHALELEAGARLTVRDPGLVRAQSEQSSVRGAA